MTLLRFVSATAFVVAASITGACASVQIGTTRVIYHGDAKNVSVQITNPGKYPVLLQSWTDDGRQEVRPDKMRTPFILTPPLTRVNAGAGQTLRLSYTGAPLPVDRESVYWLNILEVPPISQQDTNQIQVAFRSRIKLFFRPKNLDDKGAQVAISQIKWRIDNNKLTLFNPTPYFVSAVAIHISNGTNTNTQPVDMLSPRSNQEFLLPKEVLLKNINSISVSAINDYGATITVPLSRN